MEPDTESVLELAAVIREVDGSHTLGAAALAEAILAHPRSRWHPCPENTDEGDLEGLAHEVWALSQLAPGEGIEDGVDRVVHVLRRRYPQPQQAPPGITHWLPQTSIPSRHQFLK